MFKNSLLSEDELIVSYWYLKRIRKKKQLEYSYDLIIVKYSSTVVAKELSQQLSKFHQVDQNLESFFSGYRIFCSFFRYCRCRLDDGVKDGMGACLSHYSNALFCN